VAWLKKLIMAASEMALLGAAQHRKLK